MQDPVSWSMQRAYHVQRVKSIHRIATDASW